MRILIAEDDPVTRLHLRKAVEHLGHECLVAENGARAWELHEDHVVDAVISDRMMPEMSGIELCERVRSKAGIHYTYFILLTALGEKSDRLQGVQAGADDYLTKPLDLEELQIALLAAQRVTALHRRLAEQNEELQRLNVKLFAEGRRDALTGIPNRLQMQEDLIEILSRIERYGDQYCVALFDIDYFKQYNDTRGHVAGDEALRKVANLLRQQSRDSDKLYRYGGEEFLVVLPGLAPEQAAQVVDRMRAGIERKSLPQPGLGANGCVTVSAGVARLEGGRYSAIDEALQKADQALYRAKEEGRNRVAVHRERRPAPEAQGSAPIGRERSFLGSVRVPRGDERHPEGRDRSTPEPQPLGQ